MDEHDIRNEPPVKVPVPARITTVLSRTGAPDIRMFDVKAINDQIERHVSILNPDEKICATGYIDSEGAHIAVVGRVSKIPGDFRWTVIHEEKWHGGRETQAGFRWGL